jgi:hypothetical protein
MFKYLQTPFEPSGQHTAPGRNIIMGKLYNIIMGLREFSLTPKLQFPRCSCHKLCSDGSGAFARHGICQTVIKAETGRPVIKSTGRVIGLSRLARLPKFNWS